MVTADTLTDAQIRELAESGCGVVINRLCKIALNDAPTYLRASVVAGARRRIAAIINAKEK